MNQITTQSQYTEGTEPSKDFVTNHPSEDRNSPQPSDKWITPWHKHVDFEGILAEHGRVRVKLRPMQWTIQVKHSTRATWDAVSFHRETESLLRVLREKQSAKGGEHLAEDFERVRSVLQRL